MAGVIWKRTGSIIILLCLAVSSVSAAGLTASLQENVIREGGRTVLSVAVEGGGKISPGAVPDVQGLSIEYSGSGQSFSFINGRSSRTVSLNYIVTGDRPGTYIIPSFSVTVNGKSMQTQPVTINVLKGSGRQEQVEAEAEPVMPFIEMSADRVREGQPVVMRYFILVDTGISTGNWRMEEDPSIGGGVISPLDENIDDVIEESGGRQRLKRHLKSFVLTAGSTGAINAGGGRALVEVVEKGFFARQHVLRVVFPRRTLRVVPLPKGKPEGFSGNVGTFSMEETWDDDPVRVFGEKKIAVTVKGTGNLLTMAPPVLDVPSTVSVMTDSRPPVVRAAPGATEGERTFILTVIPRAPGNMKLGRVTFTYFDPGPGKYRKLQGREIVLDVLPALPAAPGSDDEEKKQAGIPSWVVTMLAVMVVCGGAAAVIILFYRGRVKDIPSGGKKPAAPLSETESRGAATRDDATVLLSSDDTDMFLRGAYKIVTRSITGGRGNAEELAALRDELDRWRFGGGTPSHADMERVRNVLSGL